jgi:hypothetical protein
MPDSAQVLVFAFRGTARTQEPNPKQDPGAVLNSWDMIADEIAADLAKRRPIGVQLDVNIEFREGSLIWIGLVYLMDWMARLSGAGALLEYIIRARFAVNRAIRWEARAPLAIPSALDTKAAVVRAPPTQGSHVFPVCVPNPF